MQITHINLENPLSLSTDIVNVLVIENPKEFYSMVSELDSQLNGEEGKFVLLDEENNASFEKYGWMVKDVFSLELNNRKILSLLYKQLEQRVYESDMLVKLNGISQAIFSCLDDLFFFFPFELSYREPMPADILKIVNVKFENNYESLQERIVCYINTLIELKKCKFFIFVNLKSVLFDEELLNIYKHCQSEKVCLLLIESQNCRKKLEGEVVTTITEDLCEILAK